MQSHSNMSDYLPVEIVIEILKRLPVVSIIRCRSVCKSWWSLISTPFFITTHLNFSLSKTQNQLLLHRYDLNIRKHRFTLHSSDDPFPRDHFTKHLNFSDPEIHTRLLSLDQEIEEKGGFFAYPLDFIELRCCSINKLSTIVGSSNGLLCFTDCFFPISYVIWNPSIFKAIDVPPISRKSRSFSYRPASHGFGYDPVTEDYKLVRVLFCNYGRSPKVEMYTIRTGKWRNIDTTWKLFPSKSVYVIGKEGISIVVNRAFHWMVKTKTGKGKENSRNIIVVFDIGTEEFAEFTVPKSLEGEEQLINMSLAVVDGLLALVPCNLYAQEEECYSVWVMREYGVAESWTKLLDIDVGEGEGNINIDIDVHEEEEEGLGRVVGFTKNGIVFTKDEDLLSYEPSSRRTLNPHIRGQPESFYMNTYVESLVLLNKADGEDASE